MERLSLFEHAGDGVWAVDGDHRIMFWNQAAEELLGYATEEAVGRSCYRLLRGRDAQGQAFCQAGCPVRARVEEDHTARSFDLVVRHRAGHTCWVNVSILSIPLETDAARKVALVHICRDLGQGSLWPPPLRIRLLGPVAVERGDGSRIQGPLWRRAKVRALLAVLALHKGQCVRRETLIETLWPDLEYEAALHNLNTTVYNLRRCLEPEIKRGADSQYVCHEGECYSLGGEGSHWIDVDAFESTIAQARRQPDPGRAKALYLDALALYRGDFVTDLDPDLIGGGMERVRLRELHLKTLEALAGVYVQLGEAEEANDLYLKILALDPWRESATRQLMHLALAHGDRAQAIVYYERLEQALRQEMGILPSEETVDLYRKAWSRRVPHQGQLSGQSSPGIRRQTAPR